MRAAVLVLLLGPAVLAAQTPSPSPAASHAPAVPADKSLPPGEAGAQAALERSPRHGEYEDVSFAGGPALRTWVVYPERPDKAPAVIVIHEIYGLSPWIRAVADQLAEDGFVALAPDFLSGRGPDGGGTESVASRDEVVALVRGLQPPEVNARLNAVREYALKLPAVNGKVAILGFCWGGARSFGYAAAQPALNAAVVFYGSSPETADLSLVQAPVLGLYGGDDERVNATIGTAQAELKRLGRTYEVHIYDGAGHGFLRAQDGREGGNLRAAQQAWPATLAFLRARLK